MVYPTLRSMANRTQRTLALLALRFMAHPVVRPVIRPLLRPLVFPALRPLASDTIVSLLAFGFLIGATAQDYFDLGYKPGPTAVHAGEAAAGY